MVSGFTKKFYLMRFPLNKHLIPIEKHFPIPTEAG